MFDRIVAFSLRQRVLVLFATLAPVAADLYSATQLPVDAVPDVANNQVQVLTQAPALSPLDVERFVTVPVELASKSLPDVVELRSLSRQGISVITVVFEDGVETYFARQLILEQLRGIADELPPGAETPGLGPVSTGLGEVFRYTLRDTTGAYSPMELRTIQDWTVRRQLLGVPGLAEVNSIGGELRQVKVLVDPDRLAGYGLTLREVFDATAEASGNAGAATIETGPEQLSVRTDGLVQSADDLRQSVVATRGGTPDTLGDVAEVRDGAAVRFGAATQDGEGEVVTGFALQLKGANARVSLAEGGAARAFTRNRSRRRWTSITRAAPPHRAMPLRARLAAVFAAVLVAALTLAACATTESGPPASSEVGYADAEAPSTGEPSSAASPARDAARSAAGRAAGLVAGDAVGVREAPADLSPRGERLSRRSQVPAGLLTAGDIDDNLNWEAFQGYRTRAQRGQSRAFPALALDDRVMVRVVDGVGQPVANARLTVEAAGGDRARRLTTEAGTDGRLALFPAYDFGPGVRALRIRAQAPDGGDAVTLSVDQLTGDRQVRIQLGDAVGERPHAMDLAIVIDVTGSMGDELAYLTSEFESIVARVERRYRDTDLRFALVAYRDAGDDFVVRAFPFVRSARQMQQQLAGLRAAGGGDYPEAMDAAMQAAVDLDWRTGQVARVAFLVADAPPHDSGVDGFLGAVRQARAAGVRVYPLAASGVADEAEYLMRHAALLTQARHLFLTDDSGIGNSHQEPKIPCYAVTALDGLMTRVIASELEGRRVEPAREEILREVGDYDAGVCEAGPVAVRDDAPQQRRGGSLGYE